LNENDDGDDHCYLLPLFNDIQQFSITASPMENLDGDSDVNDARRMIFHGWGGSDKHVTLDWYSRIWLL
jgi:hypothetical protein